MFHVFESLDCYLQGLISLLHLQLRVESREESLTNGSGEARHFASSSSFM